MLLNGLLWGANGGLETLAGNSEGKGGVLANSQKSNLGVYSRRWRASRPTWKGDRVQGVVATLLYREN